MRRVIQAPMFVPPEHMGMPQLPPPMPPLPANMPRFPAPQYGVPAALPQSPQQPVITVPGGRWVFVPTDSWGQAGPTPDPFPQQR